MIILLSLLLSQAHSANIEHFEKNEKRYLTQSATCAKNDTCDLVSFRLLETKKRMPWPQKTRAYDVYFSEAFVEYETTSLSSVEKYAVVQFIKGCMYESIKNPDGSVSVNLGMSRNHMGKDVVFAHPHWQIDNDNESPIYTAVSPENVFALLRHNPDSPRKPSREGVVYWNKQKPKVPVVFTADQPSPVMLNINDFSSLASARNASLEIKTCLYKTKDLPIRTNGDGRGVPSIRQAIACHTWDHKFAFDFAANRVVRTKEIAPICFDRDAIARASQGPMSNTRSKN